MNVRCGITMSHYLSTRVSSRSTWYPLALSQSHASHGEKLKTDQPLYQPDSNHYDFLHPAEGNQSQICNSNPLLGQFSQSITANPFSWDSTKSIKLEMEEFGDLTAYLPTTVMSGCKNEANNVDELNTPVFERRGPFEFTQQNTYDNQIDAAVHTTDDPFDFKIKVEEFDFGCLYANNNNNNNNSAFDNYLVNQQPLVLDTNNILSTTTTNNKENLVGRNNSFKATPMTHNQKMASDDDDDCIAVSDFTDILFDSNCCGEYLVVDGSNKGDESSNSSSNSGGRHRYPKLKLNITGKIIENTSTLSTPEVIETIADIENENFNILDIVNEKEFRTVSTDDLNLQITSTLTPSQTTTTTTTTSTHTYKPRKRKIREDSDEDYQPPSSTRLGRKSIKISSSSSKSSTHWNSDDETTDDDYDDDDDDDEGLRKPRRGRPPKRNMSISSDSSKDFGDAARYRELRDKNNEASRRSRLKRKMKEMGLEKEAMELEERNVKLRTQVDQLEKTVNNFRNNLFKIMLSK